MIITGDTIQPSLGTNITVPDATGINVGSNTVFQIGTTGIITQQPYWNIVEQQTSGTNGNNNATFASGSWVTRILNTTIGTNTITNSSLSSNRFTLPTGTYRILVTAPAFYVGYHKIKLANITDSTDTLIGTGEYSQTSTYPSSTNSIIRGTFTITSSKTFEIQHRCSTTYNTSGAMGLASSFSVAEIYTQVELWKIGN